MKHKKFHESFTLVEAGVAVLLTGEKGTGKTTVAMQIAEELKLKFHGVSMTRQTTLSHLMGFMNVNGEYIPSQLRNAAEFGGLFLMDEIDASDANVLLCLNTIENGYISFPDKIVDIHKNFRFIATSNPQDNHKDYNGRSKLDAATMDRFDVVELEKDDTLEQSIVDFHTYSSMELARQCLRDFNSPTYLSMRDSIRFQKRKELGLLDTYMKRLLSKDMLSFEKYEATKDSIPKVLKISDCTCMREVWEHVAGLEPAVISGPPGLTGPTPSAPGTDEIPHPNKRQEGDPDQPAQQNSTPEIF